MCKQQYYHRSIPCSSSTIEKSRTRTVKKNLPGPVLIKQKGWYTGKEIVLTRRREGCLRALHSRCGLNQRRRTRTRIDRSPTDTARGGASQIVCQAKENFQVFCFVRDSERQSNRGLNQRGTRRRNQLRTRGEGGGVRRITHKESRLRTYPETP